MAAPVGHIICALALFNSSNVVKDHDAFLAGTSFPDIRYISDISRAQTHKLSANAKLSDVLDAEPFEAGRRFHVWVDREREKYMAKNDAYRFVKDRPYKTHMLKIIEDHILFDDLKFDEQKVFSRIYDEEKAFLKDESRILSWHRILSAYFKPCWFNVTRYMSAYNELSKVMYQPRGFFKDLWFKTKALGFLLYTYYEIEKLSRDPELRNIILGFYKDKIHVLVGSKFVPN